MDEAPEKWLAITPERWAVEINLPDRSVLLLLDVSHPELGLAPGLTLALSWSPEDARKIGQSLIHKADAVLP